MSLATTAAQTDEQQLPVFESTGIPYREQGLLGHFLGRALDTIAVGAAATAIMLGLYAVGGTAMPAFRDWQGSVLLLIIMLASTFLYGGLAGTAGTLGDAATGMRAVRRCDGSRPGFWTGGFRALGWLVYIALVLMFYIAPGGDGIESPYVAVRRDSLTTN